MGNAILAMTMVLVLRNYLAQARIHIYARMNFSRVSMEERLKTALLERLARSMYSRVIADPEGMSPFGRFRIRNVSFAGQLRIYAKKGGVSTLLSTANIILGDSPQVIAGKLLAGKTSSVSRIWIDSDLKIWVTGMPAITGSTIEAQYTVVSGFMEIYDTKEILSGGYQGEFACCGCNGVSTGDVVAFFTRLLKEKCKAGVDLGEGFVNKSTCCEIYPEFISGGNSGQEGIGFWYVEQDNEVQ